jgi:RNA polymerase sigma-70 factor (ECF subfamily)
MQLLATPSSPPAPLDGPVESVERRRPSVLREVDDSLLRLAQAGDRAALQEFVRHYESRVFAFLSRATSAGPHVDDLAQEVFLRAFRALPRFEKREAKVSTWIFRIAVRLLQDHARKNREGLTTSTDDLRDPKGSPEDLCAQRAQLTRIEQAAAELPEEQRVAFVLFEFHDQTHEEIAKVTGAPTATVKTRIHRARRFLRAALLGPSKAEQ